VSDLFVMFFTTNKSDTFLPILHGDSDPNCLRVAVSLP
jgi:hypothetical protein